MQPISFLLAVLLLAAQPAVAVAAETAGDVQLVAGPFVLLRSGSGQKVVRLGPWTAYGNLAGPGSLKYGGESVRITFDSGRGGFPLAASVTKETEYSPSIDQVISVDQLLVEQAGGTLLLVDCRSKGERDAAYIPGSSLLAAAEVVKNAKTEVGTKSVVLYGGSAADLRPYATARELMAAGLADVRVLTDGLKGWRKAGKAVYASPSHLADLISGGTAFRLVDLRGASAENTLLMSGAEKVSAADVTRSAMFLRERSYQLPLFIYGDEKDSLAVAAKLAEWNYQQDGDFAILDPSWKEWSGRYDTSGYRPGQLPANEIGMEEFRALWRQAGPTMVFLNVKPKRDRSSPAELHIPLEELPERLGELPRDREIVIYCSYGLRSAVAWQILKDNGYRARFLNRTITVDANGTISN